VPNWLDGTGFANAFQVVDCITVCTDYCFTIAGSEHG
jgi:hypothetical protein